MASGYGSLKRFISVVGMSMAEQSNIVDKLDVLWCVQPNYTFEGLFLNFFFFFATAWKSNLSCWRKVYLSIFAECALNEVSIFRAVATYC